MNKENPTKFESWIFESFTVTAPGMALYRVFTALFILFFLLPSPSVYNVLGTMPADFFAPPPGPMMLFEGFPPAYVLYLLHYGLIAALLFLVFGWHTRAASLAAGILLLVLKGFIYSLGKINHDLVVVLVPLVMAFSGWGGAYSMDARLGRTSSANGWTVLLLALFIGFMMFTAGLPKIMGGWLDPSTHAVQGHYLKQFAVRGRRDLLAPYAGALGPFSWELLDYFTVFFEVGFLLALARPGSIRVFVCLAVLFHAGTMLMMNIAFLPNFLAYAAFLNWNRIDRWITTRLGKGRLSRWAPPASVAVVLLVIWLAGFLWGDTVLTESDLQLSHVVLVSAALPVAVYYLARQIQSVLAGS